MRPDLNTHSGAVFSDDKFFRYALWRKWNLHAPGKFITFIGLNPSRANETFNDPTITRLINFAKDWGYDGMYMANLFAWRDPDPSFLKQFGVLNHFEFVGYHTDEWIQMMINDSQQVVFCWGNFDVKGRDKEVMKYIPDAMCFGTNANGSPKHPLYLKKTTKLIEYEK